jgi:transposase
MNIRYRVELNQEERDQLSKMLSGGKHAARKLKRAQILLAADAGESDEAIAANVSVGGSTVYRTKRHFVLGNLEVALSEAPRRGAERKLSGKQEALLVATACSKPPEGRKRWTLDLLAGAIVKLTDHAELSRETVRRRLEENDLKPWLRDMWCIPQSLPPRRRGWMAPMSPGWRMCWTFTPKRPIRSIRWCASTRARPS